MKNRDRDVAAERVVDERAADRRGTIDDPRQGDKDYDGIRDDRDLIDDRKV